jgi:hypothetical protein
MTDPDLNAVCVDNETVIAKLRELADWLRADRIVLIVAPDQVDRTRAYVQALPFEYAPGRIEVKPLPGVPADRLIVYRDGPIGFEPVRPWPPCSAIDPNELLGPHYPVPFVHVTVTP